MKFDGKFEMRWKWLLVGLSLVAISVIAVSGEGVETDNTSGGDESPDDNDQNYDDDEQTEDAPVVANVPDTGSGDDTAADSAKIKDLAPEDEKENEDTVDVENVAIGEQKGKYMAYDDYFLSSALDGSDSGYNWNGESHNLRTIYLSSRYTPLSIKKLPTFLEAKFSHTNTANNVILSEKSLGCEIDG